MIYMLHTHTNTQHIVKTLQRIVGLHPSIYDVIHGREQKTSSAFPLLYTSAHRLNYIHISIYDLFIYNCLSLPLGEIEWEMFYHISYATTINFNTFYSFYTLPKIVLIIHNHNNRPFAITALL